MSYANMCELEPPTPEERELATIKKSGGRVINLPGALGTEEHWAIIVRYINILKPMTYVAYFNSIEWQEQIKTYTLAKMEFVAFQVKPVKVTTEVNIKIDA